VTFQKNSAPPLPPMFVPTRRDNLIEETPDYIQFKSRVYFRTGIDLNLYKQPQMHRRLSALVERTGVSDFEQYYRLLERDPQEYETFLDRLTINVSELFRNPEKWEELGAKILTPMLEKNKPLRIWSAGCSYGAEPYSLTILLDQLGNREQDNSLPNHLMTQSPNDPIAHTLHATDLDKNILAKAREGKFSRADMKSVPQSVQERYFTLLSEMRPSELPEFLPAFAVKPELRNRVAFRAHNLLADAFEKEYDLICCRNVVIYFTDEAKDKLYARFRDALKVGGVLFVGGTERIFNARELGLVSTVPFFYQRVG